MILKCFEEFKMDQPAWRWCHFDSVLEEENYSSRDGPLGRVRRISPLKEGAFSFVLSSDYNINFLPCLFPKFLSQHLNQRLLRSDMRERIEIFLTSSLETMLHLLTHCDLSQSYLVTVVVTLNNVRHIPLLLDAILLLSFFFYFTSTPVMLRR